MAKIRNNEKEGKDIWVWRKDYFGYKVDSNRTGELYKVEDEVSAICLSRKLNKLEAFEADQKNKQEVEVWLESKDDGKVVVKIGKNDSEKVIVYIWDYCMQFCKDDAEELGFNVDIFG